jgi:uncharacterized membrane protein
MQGLEPFGKWLIIGGIALVITGGLFLLLSKLSGVRHLPGTLQVEAGGMTCIFPILGSIILSIVLTVVLNLIIRIINR